jgi:hypothetical protein
MEHSLQVHMPPFYARNLLEGRQSDSRVHMETVMTKKNIFLAAENQIPVFSVRRHLPLPFKYETFLPD